jgi:predicted MFS family arabinose efflux permease
MRAAAISLAVGLVLADSSIAVLALPAIYREFELDLADLHWVLTSFNLALALAAIPAARLTRRAAPVAVFAAGLTVFAVASAACALAPSFEALVAFRAVQAVGGAAGVVAALELLPALVHPRRRALALWVGAGAAGAALGPAVGGALTEAISWQAVFAVQVPLALLPLPFLLGLQRRRAVSARAVRPRLAPNLALALLSAGLAAALFLVVLLLIEGWRLSPLAAAAIASTLPLAAIATAPLAGRIRSGRARSAAGAVLVAGGLAALASLPQASWAWTLPPQILIGAGLALALAALTETALADRDAPALHGGVTIAARHAGVVLGLLLLAPLLVGDLDREREAAEQTGTARLLDAPVTPATKLELAQALSQQLEQTPGRIPDLAPAFRSIDPAPHERPALARLEHALDDLLDEAVTSSFSRPFLLAAALALAALAPIALPRKAPA